jgi:hypothetical protein
MARASVMIVFLVAMPVLAFTWHKLPKMFRDGLACLEPGSMSKSAWAQGRPGPRREPQFDQTPAVENHPQPFNGPDTTTAVWPNSPQPAVDLAEVPISKPRRPSNAPPRHLWQGQTANGDASPFASVPMQPVGGGPRNELALPSHLAGPAATAPPSGPNHHQQQTQGPHPALSHPRMAEMQQRLQQMGAEHYRLEAWGPDSERSYYCACDLGPRVAPLFEARDQDPLRAVELVVRALENWQMSQPTTKNPPHPLPTAQSPSAWQDLPRR